MWQKFDCEVARKSAPGAGAAGGKVRPQAYAWANHGRAGGGGAWLVSPLC